MEVFLKLNQQQWRIHFLSYLSITPFHSNIHMISLVSTLREKTHIYITAPGHMKHLKCEKKGPNLKRITSSLDNYLPINLKIQPLAQNSHSTPYFEFTPAIKWTTALMINTHTESLTCEKCSAWGNRNSEIRTAINRTINTYYWW